MFRKDPKAKPLGLPQYSWKTNKQKKKQSLGLTDCTMVGEWH